MARAPLLPLLYIKSVSSALPPENTHKPTEELLLWRANTSFLLLLLLRRHSYPSLCPPLLPSPSPPGVVNKPGLCGPSRGLLPFPPPPPPFPTLHHHSSFLPPRPPPAHSAAALHAAERRQGDAQMIRAAVLNYIAHTSQSRQD